VKNEIKTTKVLAINLIRGSYLCSKHVEYFKMKNLKFFRIIEPRRKFNRKKMGQEFKPLKGI
jgi:hypothetical protein